MEDSAAQRPEDEPEGANEELAHWAAENNRVLKSIAGEYPTWARAIQADAGLSKRVAEIAKLAASTNLKGITSQFKGLKGLTDQLQGLKGIGGSVALPSQFSTPILQNLAGSVAPLGFPNLGMLQEFPAGMGLSAEQQRRWVEEMLPNLREIQRSLTSLNRPTATRATQSFLTNTDTLRYRSSRRVWHYTNAQALQQILRHHVLWASSPHHLNDASELTHGVDIVRQALERAAKQPGGPTGVDLKALREVTDSSFIEEAMHEIYYISASGSDDSLTLWRNYSSSDGFAIGIKPGRPLSAEGLALTEADPTAEVPVVAQWYKVQYVDSAKVSLADDFVRSARTDVSAAAAADKALVIKELRKHLLILASTMKHAAFRDEREVRWITTNWAPVDVIHYEVTGRGFVPVLHVRTAGVDLANEPHLPITGVRCSPTTSPTIERTMRGLLEQRGYSVAAKDVEKSLLPFRG